jgi:hypothetical protein
MKIINNLLLFQKVEYDFQYHQIDFPTDIATIILSHGKSLFSVNP